MEQLLEKDYWKSDKLSSAFFTLIPNVGMKTCGKAKHLFIGALLMQISE
jgi:hypothetical protein